VVHQGCTVPLWTETVDTVETGSASARSATLGSEVEDGSGAAGVSAGAAGSAAEDAGSGAAAGSGEGSGWD
jgi:hypothetical protein